MIQEKSWTSRLFDLTNYLILVLFGLLCLLPMIHIVAVSLSNRSASMGGFVTLWPIGFTWRNYAEILAAGPVYQAFFISVQRTVLGTLINMILTVLAAYPLSKSAQEFKGRNWFMWIMIVALLFNGGLIPWFLVIRNLGLLNSLWALIFPGALPIWNVILLMNFFRELPKELEEAAIIDGASYWAILLYIYLPLSVPALATLTLFAAVGHWNAWFDGMILITKNAQYPIMTFLRTVVVDLNLQILSVNNEDIYNLSDRSIRAANIVVATLPILLVYPFLQRYFIHGIRLGAVKG
ncbi:MAG: carbohydrate ABC transporter permease [Chloroflexi bacterium]|nr:carbohydrate ABC transporter permease [Chloroflexota bacterium]